jgi:hypothetical protein
MLTLVLAAAAASAEPWVTYTGGEGPGAGKHIVLVSGDEEYRSEEMLPQLGKMLAAHHGFTCTVLFAINPETGLIHPNHQNNIPGLEALADADLLVIFTRFRALPDAQMQVIDDYLQSGKPVLGIRTATHAFNFPEDSAWAHYGNGYRGDKREWRDGFGRLILGEKWISHHGEHKHESTRGRIAPGAEGHPLLRGIDDGAIWGPTDVYGIRLRVLPENFTPLVLGEVVRRDGEFDENDLHYGMRPTDQTPVEGEKNDPMMPIAWTKPYQIPGGREGKVFTTTMGGSADFTNEAFRRLVVNAVFSLLGMEEAIPEEGAAVDLVGDYAPTAFAFHDDAYWADRAMRVEDHAWAKE